MGRGKGISWADRIRARLSKRRLSVHEISCITNIAESRIYDFIHGKGVGIDYLERLAKLAGFRLVDDKRIKQVHQSGA